MNIMKSDAVRASQVGIAMLLSSTAITSAAASERAADAGAPTHSPSAQSEMPDELVVTAAKRETSLVSIPSAVSAFGEEAIEFRSLSRADDLVGVIPSLQVSEQTGASLITIRGAGLVVDTGYAEPGVAIYSDGLYQPRTGSSFLGSVDLERIEVLRGPQGTLYGRNATGGVVNFITKKPTDEFEAVATVGMGNLDTVTGRAIVSGPIHDQVRARIVAATSARGEYLTNLGTADPEGEREERGLRGTIEFFPSDALTVSLIGRYQEAETSPYSVLVTPPTAIDQAILSSANGGAPVLFTLDQDALFEERNIENGSVEDWSVTSQIGWSLNDIDVKFIVGYIENSTFFDVPNDALSVPFIELVREDLSEAYSAELNVSGQFGSLEWLIGGFYFHEDYDASLGFRFRSTEIIPGAPGMVLDNSGLEENENIGIFADGIYHVTDRFRVFGGLRYSQDDKSIVQTNVAYLGPPGAALSVVDGCTFLPAIQTLNLEDSWDDLSPRVGVQYDLGEDANVYAQFQKGYKAGGWNFTGPCGDAFEPEEIDAYEVGFKSRLFNRSLDLNLTGFYYDYRDLQVFTSRVSTAFVVNAPEARVYGAELEARALLTDVFSVDVVASAMNARYREFMDLDIVTGTMHDLKDRPLARAPDYAFTIGAQADVPLSYGHIGGLTARLEAAYTDDIAFRPYSGEDVQEAYWLVNGYVEIFGSEGRYSLRGFLRNAIDEEYLNQIFGGGVVTSGYRKGTPGLPRTYGAELTVRF